MQDASRLGASDNVQPDENLSGPAAAQKIADLVKPGNSCFFCTLGMGTQLHARPMTVIEVEDSGQLWFFTEVDSLKNIELDRDPRVTLFFKESDNGGHLKLDGTAAEVSDKATIHRLWSPKLRAWFTEGEDDPRISLLRVDPVSGEYWDNRHGAAITGIKMLFGAITAQRVDEGVHGQLKL
ncbi:MAG: pyridoxamine 5'-phosphate oxidase family protein [Burkholderiales bacterium]|jgi:general stress protein 26|nr:pyridoxamine 5'-phosphate oxidase family protein [Burkholderiales bacterium]